MAYRMLCGLLFLIYNSYQTIVQAHSSKESYVIRYLEDRQIVPVTIELDLDQQTEFVINPKGGTTLYDFTERKVAYKDQNSSQCFIEDLQWQTLEKDRRRLNRLKNGIIRGSYIPTLSIEAEILNSTELLLRVGLRITQFCNGSTASLVTKQESQIHRRKRDTSISGKNGQKGQFTHHSYGHYGHQTNNYAHYGHETYISGNVDKDGKIDGQRVSQYQVRSEGSQSYPAQGTRTGLQSIAPTTRLDSTTGRDQTEIQGNNLNSNLLGREFGPRGAGQFSLQTDHESGYQLNLPLGLRAGNAYRGTVRSQGQYGVGGAHPKIETQRFSGVSGLSIPSGAIIPGRHSVQPSVGVPSVEDTGFPFRYPTIPGTTIPSSPGTTVHGRYPHPPSATLPVSSGTIIPGRHPSPHETSTSDLTVRSKHIYPPGSSIPSTPLSGIPGEHLVPPGAAVSGPVDITIPGRYPLQTGAAVPSSVGTAIPGRHTIPQTGTIPGYSGTGIPGSPGLTFPSRYPLSPHAITGDSSIPGRYPLPGAAIPGSPDSGFPSRYSPGATIPGRYPVPPGGIISDRYPHLPVTGIPGQLGLVPSHLTPGIQTPFQREFRVSHPSYPTDSNGQIIRDQLGQERTGYGPGTLAVDSSGSPVTLRHGATGPEIGVSQRIPSTRLSGLLPGGGQISERPDLQVSRYPTYTGGQFPSEIRPGLSLPPGTDHRRIEAGGVSPLTFPSGDLRGVRDYVPGRERTLPSGDLRGVRDYVPGQERTLQPGISHDAVGGLPPVARPIDPRLPSAGQITPAASGGVPLGYQLPITSGQDGIHARYTPDARGIPSPGISAPYYPGHQAPDGSLAYDGRHATGGITADRQGALIDVGDSASSQTQVQTGFEGTAAEASSAGSLRGLGSQTQVQGGYTGNGSFSAQAQSGFTGGVTQSQVQGGKQGGISGSSAQVERLGSAQSQVQIGQPSGASSSSAQGRFSSGTTQVQAQSGRSGGSAGAQAQSSGLSSSQVQVNVGGEDSRQKDGFQGSVSASVHGGRSSGQSQTQLQGGYDSGRTYVATAQGGFDSAAGFQGSVPSAGSIPVLPLTSGRSFLPPGTVERAGASNLTSGAETGQSVGTIDNRQRFGIDKPHPRPTSTLDGQRVPGSLPGGLLPSFTDSISRTPDYRSHLRQPGDVHSLVPPSGTLPYAPGRYPEAQHPVTQHELSPSSFIPGTPRSGQTGMQPVVSGPGILPIHSPGTLQPGISQVPHSESGSLIPGYLPGLPQPAVPSFQYKPEQIRPEYQPHISSLPSQIALPDHSLPSYLPGRIQPSILRHDLRPGVAPDDINVASRPDLRHPSGIQTGIPQPHLTPGRLYQPQGSLYPDTGVHKITTVLPGQPQISPPKPEESLYPDSVYQPGAHISALVPDQPQISPSRPSISHYPDATFQPDIRQSPPLIPGQPQISPPRPSPSVYPDTSSQSRIPQPPSFIPGQHQIYPVKPHVPQYRDDRFRPGIASPSFLPGQTQISPQGPLYPDTRFHPGIPQPPSLIPGQIQISPQGPLYPDTSFRPGILQPPSLIPGQTQISPQRPLYPDTSLRPGIPQPPPLISGQTQISTPEPHGRLHPDESPVSRLPVPSSRDRDTSVVPTKPPGVSEPDLTGEGSCCDALRNLKRRCCDRSSRGQRGVSRSSCCSSKDNSDLDFDIDDDIDDNNRDEPCKVVKAICYIVYKPVGKARICKPTNTNGCR